MTSRGRGQQSASGVSDTETKSLLLYVDDLETLSQRTVRCWSSCLCLCRSISLDDLRATLLSPIRSIFSCNLSSLPDIFFAASFSEIAWRSKMSSIDKYRLCTTRVEKPHGLNIRYRECIPTLSRQCEHSEVVAIKTILLRMDLVEELLRTDPLLRLVYLIRDPRGMLNSWWKNTRISRQNYSDADRELDARAMCTRMHSDWKAFVRLRQKFPDNSLLLRYEDLAESPDAAADRVYRSLGYSGAPRAVIGALRTITAAKNPNGNYGIRRANSSMTADAWIDSMRPTLKTMVNRHCHQVLREIGFHGYRVNRSEAD